MSGSLFVLILSDLHAFHVTGLTPKNFQGSHGGIVPLNFVQEYLWDCWQHQLRQLPQGIDLLLLNGDLAEGQQPAEHGRGIVETDPVWQARGTVQLLKPIADRVVERNGRRMIQAQRGTRYHTGRGGAIEEQIAEALGALPDRYGRYTPPWRRFYVNGVYFDVAHRQSFTTRNRSMPMEREVGFMLERFGRRREKVPKNVIIIRSHTHTGFRMWSEDNGITVISTPSWKIQDDFAQGSISPNRLEPSSLGSVGIWIHPHGSKKRVTVVRYLYDHPVDDVEEIFPNG